MRIRLLVLALVALCPLSLISQRPAIAADARIPTARAEDVGMSADRLARVKAAMQRYVDRGEVPGSPTRQSWVRRARRALPTERN